MNLLHGDYQGAQDALSRALAIAEREGDRALQMQTLAFTADMEAHRLHWDQSLEAAQLAIELTNYAENPLAEFFAHLWAACILLVTGKDSERVRQHAEAGLLAAERLHDHVWLPIALGALTCIILILGSHSSNTAIS